jgi:apolipoprotein N-acyltransferase
MDKRSFFCCVSSGLLLALSFPPLKLGLLAFVGLAPLIYLVDHELPIKISLKYGYVTGFFFNLGTIYWIAWDTEPGLLIIVSATIAVILILSLFFMIFVFFFTLIRKRLGEYALFSAPFLWTAIEYLRSVGVLAFPWTSLAYSQSYYLPFIQFSSLTSVYGVSFWVVAVNIAFYMLFKKGLNQKSVFVILLMIVGLFLFPYVYGKCILSKMPQEADLHVTLVQGNIDPRMKWDERYRQYNVDVYLDMTKKNTFEKAELIVWPETAIPYYVAYDTESRIKIQHVADSLNVPILTGAPHFKYDRTRDYVFYNSAFLFIPGLVDIQEYAKIHLVPFSEHTPFSDIFPFLMEVNFGQSDFSPGTEYTLFEIPKGKFAVLICFESIFPELVRKFVKQDADFLVNITNDAWFGKTSSPYQHARIAIFRAIENRIGIARCANTGISMFVDPFGRITDKTEIFKRRAL